MTGSPESTPARKDTEAIRALNGLKIAAQEVLAELEKLGVPARSADEMIRDVVFEAWWDWDYEVVDEDDEVSP